MASMYRFGVYQDGLRGWRRESSYDFLTGTTPAAGMVAIFATREAAEADAEQRNPTRDPMPGAAEYPTYAVCDLNDESTYVTRQNIGRNGSNVVARGKLAIVTALGK